jgi:hypothetical protein
MVCDMVNAAKPTRMIGAGWARIQKSPGSACSSELLSAKLAEICIRPGGRRRSISKRTRGFRPAPDAMQNPLLRSSNFVVLN